MTRIRSYSELSQLETFEERLAYLRLGGSVGRETFGFDRHLNQVFYRSKFWKWARQDVILRDNSCDLGIRGYEIFDSVHIHHMNPITIEDIEDRSEDILDPEFLVCTSFRTHQAIHFAKESTGPPVVIERSPGDQKLW